MTDALRLERLKLTLERPHESARGGVVARRALGLTVSGPRGSGAAEVAPLDGFSCETLEEAFEALRKLETLGNSLDVALDEISGVLPNGPPSARFALQAALLDGVGRSEGLPAARLLGASSDALRSVALLDSLDAALSQAETAAESGAPGVKLKIGRPGRAEEEGAILRAIRKIYGVSFLIRADANGSLGDARHPLLEVLAEIGADYVEEPFPVERLLGGEVPACPVALDESVARAPAACLEVVARGRAAALVIKPTLHGVSRALELGREARRRGGRAVVGHLFEPPRAFAALVHVALALDAAEVHGLSCYPGLESWRSVEGGGSLPVPAFLRGSAADVSATRGLG